MMEVGGSDAALKLESYIKRWEALNDEAADINAAKRDLRKEAKGDGYDIPTMKAILDRRALEPAVVMERDLLLETYEAALKCGAQSAGVLSATRGEDGIFTVQMIAAPDAAEKLMIPMPVDDPLRWRGSIRTTWAMPSGWCGSPRACCSGSRSSAGSPMTASAGRRATASGSRRAWRTTSRGISTPRRRRSMIAEGREGAGRGVRLPLDPGIAKDRVVALRKHAVKSGNASGRRRCCPGAHADAGAAGGFRHGSAGAERRERHAALRRGPPEGGGWDVRFSPHDPATADADRGFSYEPKALPGLGSAHELVQPEKDQRELLQQTYGYCLTGLTDEQKWFIYQGRGGDGKSLTNDVIADGMGDYYRHADVETFLQGRTQKSGSEHSSDLARLQGDIRLVTCDEPTSQFDVERHAAEAGDRQHDHLPADAQEPRSSISRAGS
jgi:uncharacterized protein (UPF0335 family)